MTALTIQDRSLLLLRNKEEQSSALSFPSLVWRSQQVSTVKGRQINFCFLCLKVWITCNIDNSALLFVYSRYSWMSLLETLYSFAFLFSQQGFYWRFQLDSPGKQLVFKVFPPLHIHVGLAICRLWFISNNFHVCNSFYRLSSSVIQASHFQHFVHSFPSNVTLASHLCSLP